MVVSMNEFMTWFDGKREAETCAPVRKATY